MLLLRIGYLLDVTELIYSDLDDYGKVLVYRRDDTLGLWKLSQTLISFNVSSSVLSPHFGNSLARYGNNTVAVGCFREYAVYIFELNDTQGLWNLKQKINGSSDLNFGSSISFSGNLMLVGANFAIVGENSYCGAALVYSRNITTGLWTQMQRLVASDGSYLD